MADAEHSDFWLTLPKWFTLVKQWFIGMHAHFVNWATCGRQHAEEERKGRIAPFEPGSCVQAGFRALSVTVCTSRRSAQQLALLLQGMTLYEHACSELQLWACLSQPLFCLSRCVLVKGGSAGISQARDASF